MGTHLIRDRLDLLRSGKGSESSWDELEALAEQMRAHLPCAGVGKTCAQALLDALGHFSDELLR